MKMTPLASGGTPGVNINTSTPSRMKAIQAENHEVEQAKEPIDIRRIKMRVNRSPDRLIKAIAEAEEPVVAAEGANPDKVVQAPAVEETKPLSPQVAALAKERRAIQRERMELETMKKEMAATKPTDGSEQLISRLKAKPLSVLQEYGVTYDQLTEALLSQSDGSNQEIQTLKEDIKALKEGVDKSLTERDQAAEKQVLAEMQRDAESLAKAGDTFELVREEGRIPDVMKLIHETYKSTGEVLDVSEAMQLVEDELLKDNLRRIKFKKIQSQLTPQAPQPVQKQTQMRTLTNRDSSSTGLSRRERAVLAMTGSLTKG